MKQDVVSKENRVTVRLGQELGHQFRITLAVEQETAQSVLEQMVRDYISLHKKERE